MLTFFVVNSELSPHLHLCTCLKFFLSITRGLHVNWPQGNPEQKGRNLINWHLFLSSDCCMLHLLRRLGKVKGEIRWHNYAMISNINIIDWRSRRVKFVPCLSFLIIWYPFTLNGYKFVIGPKVPYC